MSGNIINKVPYLRTSRNFPLEAQPLAVEMNRSYVDVANAVNSRIIGLFATGNSSITGEEWFLNTTQRQQTIRQAYTGTGTGSFPTGLIISELPGPTKFYGTFLDGSGNWCPLPYVDVTNIVNQVNIIISESTNNIVITTGAGRSEERRVGKEC